MSPVVSTVERSTVWLAAVAAVRMSSGQEAGAFSPNSTARSNALPMASSMRGLTSPQMSYPASSRTASGMGTMTASSSALRNFFSHACLLVFFRPVSPLTKYASGRTLRTGMVRCARLMFGARVASCMTLDCCTMPWRISRETSSGMSAWAPLRSMMSETGMLFSLGAACCLADGRVHVDCPGAAAAGCGGCGPGLRVGLGLEAWEVLEQGVEVDLAVLTDVLVGVLAGLEEGVVDVGDLAGELDLEERLLPFGFEMLELLGELVALGLEAFGVAELRAFLSLLDGFRDASLHRLLGLGEAAGDDRVELGLGVGLAGALLGVLSRVVGGFPGVRRVGRLSLVCHVCPGTY